MCAGCINSLDLLLPGVFVTEMHVGANQQREHNQARVDPQLNRLQTKFCNFHNSAQ